MIAYTQDLYDGFATLATVAATDGAVSYFPGEDDGYQFRVKYVQGADESPWTVSNPLEIGVGSAGLSQIFLPIVDKE